jgi:ClpX C4-type zinc finger
MIDDRDCPAKPPPAIASERVLHYAFLDNSVGFNAGHGLMFIDGKELGKVPRLAISESKKSSKASLFYCDDDWHFVGVSVHDSVPSAKKRAERIYPSSSGKWIEANFTQDEVDLYLDQVWASSRCSFCGKTPDEDLNAIFEGDANARICDNCVVELYRELEEYSRSTKRDNSSS